MWGMLSHPSMSVWLLGIVLLVLCGVNGLDQCLYVTFHWGEEGENNINNIFQYSFDGKFAGKVLSNQTGMNLSLSFVLVI